MRRLPRTFLAAVVAASLLASCGPAEPRADDRTPGPAFTSLAPEVYEPCGATGSRGGLWVLGCNGIAVHIPVAGPRVVRRVEGDFVSLDALAAGGDEGAWVLVATGKGRARRGRLIGLATSEADRSLSVELGASLPMGAAFAGTELWVAAIDGRVFAVRGTRARRLAKGSPLVRLVAAGGDVWTIAENGDVVERNESGAASRSFRGVAPEPIAAAAGLGSVWLATEKDGVLRLDPASGNLTRVGVAGTVNDIEPCGAKMWASQPDVGVYALDARGTVVRTVPLPVGARYLACVAERLWIVTEDGRLGSIEA